MTPAYQMLLLMLLIVGTPMQETMRMHPVVAMGTILQVNAPSIYLGGGLTVPRGTAVVIPTHALHNASFLWDRPHLFLPGPPHLCFCSSCHSSV